MKVKLLITDSIKIYLAATLLCGGVYTFLVYGIGKVFFNHKAEGSLIIKNNAVVGSELIGQGFSSRKYFRSRPSAIDNNPLPSGASNLSWTSKDLQNKFVARRQQFRTENELLEDDTIPSEMLFASGSGVDPHITAEGAKLQVGKIAKERNLSADAVAELDWLIDGLSENSFFNTNNGKFINVNKLNIALDELSMRYAK